MKQISRVAVLLVVSAIASFASPIMIAFSGNPSTIGDPLMYQVFGAQLTSPDGVNFTLKIQTNYPTAISNGATSIPGAIYGDGSGPFFIGDFLISWNGNDYGVVLHDHDGYSAGSLYKASLGGPSFFTSGDIMESWPSPPQHPPAGPPGRSPNPSFPTELASGGSLLGGGSLVVNTLGDGVSQGKYEITVTFTAPAGFVDGGDLVAYFTSWACANGVLGGGGTPVPEPTSMLLVGSALIGLSFILKRRSSRQQH